MSEGARLTRREKRAARARNRPRRNIDFKKAMFVLPNLFTVSSIFCGFYAISLCLDSPEPLHLRRAAIAIFFAMFFDMADGRVARMTKTQSEFGVQLDSLADVCSFGVAPAVLLYRWSLDELGFLGLFGASLFLICGALRLARFNVLAAHDKGSSKHFVGLPIPLAAGCVVAMVLASYPFIRPSPDAPMVITLSLTPGSMVSVRLLPSASFVATVVLALLMVSTVRYRTFKDFKPNRKSLTIVVILATFFAAVSAQITPAIALSLLFAGYIGAGLVEQLLFYGKRRRDGEGPTPGDPAAPSAHP
ncbi:MAG: CDP-diacylglycerol--serine O-phosphatidyltransferase [Deltaproteobacteria bacterium]|nr:CDP-diacylglycerol--serine O-phosphatidyltransferase [Deltaproteobacteria bacterium]